MTRLTQSTPSIKGGQIKRNWHLIDVKGKVLGRQITQISRLLQGKNKVNYVSHLDMGDYVVVINSSQVKVTGKKNKNKLYTRYSGYPGGKTTLSFEKLKEKNPNAIIRHAVSGMLPKNKLRDKRLSRLFIFSGNEHSYKNKFNKN